MPTPSTAAGSPEPSTRYDLLDGMRGIAALIVVWLHITSICHVYVQLPNPFLAVDFFFCLSGFVVAHARAKHLRCGYSVSDFMRRRAIRLMPLALLGAGLGGCVLVFRSWLRGDVRLADSLITAGLNAVLLPSSRLAPTYPEAFGANPPLWSLLQEMLASLALAAGLARLSTPRLAILAAVAAYVTVWFSLSVGTLDLGGSAETTWCAPVRVVFPFLSGMLIQRLPIVAHSNGLVAVLVLAALLLSPVSSIGGQLVSVLLLFPLIVYRGAGAQVGPRLTRISRELGALSYPLYAVHYPAIRLVRLCADWVGITNPILIAVAAGGLPLVFAVIAMRLFEPPVRRWLAPRGNDSAYVAGLGRLATATH